MIHVDEVYISNFPSVLRVLVRGRSSERTALGGWSVARVFESSPLQFIENYRQVTSLTLAVYHIGEL
jgi:hypothetical protein